MHMKFAQGLKEDILFNDMEYTDFYQNKPVFPFEITKQKLSRIFPKDFQRALNKQTWPANCWIANKRLFKKAGPTKF